jgi:hypothetical protein
MQCNSKHCARHLSDHDVFIICMTLFTQGTGSPDLELRSEIDEDTSHANQFLVKHWEAS